jgi:uncharacterized membrane protein YfcA
MRRSLLTSWFLLALAAVCAGLTASLIGWGGRIEVSLLVFGDPVQVVIDAGSPRVLLLPALPVLLVAAALYLRRLRRS